MKAGLAIFALGLLQSLQVQAEPDRRAASRLAVFPANERIGCYWYRERLFCSRYCYWEINGKRYCRERERDAHSQAPAVESVPYPYAPMKLGRQLRND